MIKELIFKLTSKDLTKVYHRGCGGHVGYIAETGRSKRDVDNFYFLDGAHPEGCDIVSIPCEKCNKNIKHIGDLVVINKALTDA